MSLPIRTTLEDVQNLCNYFATKPTGAAVADAKKIIDEKCVDARKINAMKKWALLVEVEGDNRLKITDDGRHIAKNGGSQRDLGLRNVITRIAPYAAIIERVNHKNEISLSANDVAAHWHNHFRAEVSDNDKILNDQAVCFFQVAEGAKLGTMVTGRKGNPTRFDFNAEAVQAFVASGGTEGASADIPVISESGSVAPFTEPTKPHAAPPATSSSTLLGQGIFIAHGKNKVPLEQLKKILDQFKVPYKVAVEEPNLGRPISTKVKETMESCNCAVLIFTADEEFKTKDDKTIWRPSENVTYELGASGYLYGNRMVILKEDSVSFPSNFRDLCYISFAKDTLESKTMDIIKELIGFGILKVTV